MRNVSIIVAMIWVLASCTHRYQSDKSFEAKTNQIIINTIVNRYSSTKKRFYGTINICNQTTDTISFNFNQLLFVEEDLVLKADYNIFPISYACSAFDIEPSNCAAWNVIWQAEKKLQNISNIKVRLDTLVSKSRCK